MLAGCCVFWHMVSTSRLIWLLLAACSLAAAEEPRDALAIMQKVAANTAAATDARRQYVYTQSVRASLARGDGRIARKETRQFLVVPQETTTDALSMESSDFRKAGADATIQHEPPQ